MPHDTHTHNLPDPPPPPSGDPPRVAFWRRGARRAAGPPPPIWELPELDPPGLWTRLKQRTDRWLGGPSNQHGNQHGNDARTDTRAQDDAARPPATGQEPRPARTGARREDTAQVRPPAVGAVGERPSTPPPAEDADDDSASPPISASVLESAYEAVRQGRIADPATIREIAARFARITPEAAMSDDLAFDPRDAVRALRQRAEEIARVRGLGDDEDEDTPTSGPSPARGRGEPETRAPRRPAPQVERDENITRGG